MKNTKNELDDQKNKAKIDNNDVLMGIGGLTEAALLDSMTKSKTLTIMVIVLLVLFGGLFWFLFGMS